MSRPVSEEDLIDWQNNKFLDDDLHCHFENKDQWYWPDIKNEWIRLNNLMFGADVQLNSPIEELASAAICQGFKGAISAVAAALGVDAQTLELSVAEWVEGKAEGKLPAQIGFEGLKNRCAEWEAKQRQLEHDQHK